MIYFFDFDGTIVDVWKRFYSVFLDAGHITNVSFSDYKKLKLALRKDSYIASFFDQVLSNDYYEEKKIRLEEYEYLNLDSLLVEPKKLIDFFKKNEAFILSKRRNKEHLIDELKRLHLDDIIEKTIVLNPDDNISKLDYLKKNISCAFTLIGDSYEEYEARVLHNSFIILVNTGLFSFSNEIETKNCRLIKDINCFLEGDIDYAI